MENSESSKKQNSEKELDEWTLLLILIGCAIAPWLMAIIYLIWSPENITIKWHDKSKCDIIEDSKEEEK